MTIAIINHASILIKKISIDRGGAGSI